MWQYLYDANRDLCAKYSGSSAITLSSCGQSGVGITDYPVNLANELTGTGFGYDGNGSQTDDASTFSSASYNLLGQLSSITPTGGGATALSYQSSGQAARTALGSVSYVNGALGLDEETGSPNTFYTVTPDGSFLGERRSGSSYYFLFDGIGSVTAATDSSGNVVRTFAYDPYGAITAQTGSLYEPITYAGGYSDTVAGGAKLVKFGQRYYDPLIGRWTQTDEIVDPLALSGWNQYDYAGDDPINNADPSGMCWTGLCWAKHLVHHSKSAALAAGATLIGAVATSGGVVVFLICEDETEGLGSFACEKAALPLVAFGGAMTAGGIYGLVKASR